MEFKVFRNLDLVDEGKEIEEGTVATLKIKEYFLSMIYMSNTYNENNYYVVLCKNGQKLDIYENGEPFEIIGCFGDKEPKQVQLLTIFFNHLKCLKRDYPDIF